MIWDVVVESVHVDQEMDLAQQHQNHRDAMHKVSL
jgi:hypothetical protein